MGAGCIFAWRLQVNHNLPEVLFCSLILLAEEKGVSEPSCLSEPVSDLPGWARIRVLKKLMFAGHLFDVSHCLDVPHVTPLGRLRNKEPKASRPPPPPMRRGYECILLRPLIHFHGDHDDWLLWVSGFRQDVSVFSLASGFVISLINGLDLTFFNSRVDGIFLIAALPTPLLQHRKCPIGL